MFDYVSKRLDSFLSLSGSLLFEPIQNLISSQFHRARVLWYCRRTEKDREMRFVQNYSSTLKVPCAFWPFHRTFLEAKERQSRKHLFLSFPRVTFLSSIDIERRELQYRWGLSFVLHVLKYLWSNFQLLTVLPKWDIWARAEASFRDSSPTLHDKVRRETLRELKYLTSGEQWEAEKCITGT